jgi:lysine-specific demethylase 8
MGRLRTPVLFSALAGDWQALTRWTPEFLKSIADERKVTVVVGNRETYAPRFRTIALQEYLQLCFFEPAPKDEAHYLKEYDLLAAFPELAADLDLSLLTFPGAKTWRFAWVGQRGGRTGFHYDVFNNILTQLAGTKELVLIPPEQSGNMYPNSKFDYGARLSKVDGFAPDLIRFPRYKEALAHARRYTLTPGDALYIPRGYWHQAESLTPTISLSGFTANLWERLTVFNWERLRAAAHKLGLYKHGNCTCHAEKRATREKHARNARETHEKRARNARETRGGGEAHRALLDEGARESAPLLGEAGPGGSCAAQVSL